MRNNVAIYGGFAGNKTALSDRQLIDMSTPSSTTLSGEIGNPNSTTDNSYHVISNPTGLTTGTPTATALLDGVVITGGNANGIFPNNVGGAMYNVNSSPGLTNCSFVNNAATTSGGAIYNVNSSLTASYSLFDQSVTGYTSVTGNLTATVSPFASATSTQLATPSPAINAGDLATTSALVGTIDLAGNPRFINTLIDMGAYEFQDILEVFTLKDGLWNDASTWSAGCLLLGSERVRLKHTVTIPTRHLALSSTLLYDPVSKLIYNTGGQLQLGQ